MKSKNINILVYLAVVLAFAMLLTACGGDDTATPEAPAADEPAVEEPVDKEPAMEDVTITYWHTMSDPETEQLANVVAAFEAANPGIKVETTRFAYDDFKPALLTGLAGGEAPDTARMDIAWVSEFADQGALMQLDGVMPGFEEIADGTFPGPLSTNYWQGHYYGLPQNTNTQVLLWHAEDYEAAGLSGPPATMGEFAEAACALTSGEEQYGYALGGTYFWAPAPVFYAMGGQIVDEDITTASGYINGAESVAAFDMLTKLYNDGCISPNLLGGGIGTADGHATGLYANIIDGPWMVDIYKGNYPDFEVNFALIPTGPDGTTSSVVGGEDVVIFDGTEQADAAMAWAAYLLSEESQLMMAEVGVIPTLKSVIGDESLPEYFNVFLEQLQTAQARVPHPSWSDMDNAINNAFQRMLRGEQSPQDALDQAAVEIDALIAGEAPPEPEAEQPVAEPVAISYWHTMSDPETEQLANVVAAFEAANPGIKVETTRFAYDDFKPALLTGLAGGEAPDTARMDIAWVSEFADQGALMQLDGVMPGFEEIADGTFPGPLSTNYWQGHYYGLPQNTNTQVLLWHAEDYEAAGLSEPPATMEEFAEAACALTSGEEQYGYALGGTYFWAPAPVFYAMGGQIVDEDITTASGYINGAESVAAFDMLTKLYNDGCISPNLLGGGIGTADGHATGLYTNIIDGPWMVDIYKGNYPDFEVNFALIPTGPDGTTSSVVGGEDVVIFDGSEQADAAMAWAAYLLSEESQLMMAEVGVIPTLKSVIGDESLPEYFNVFLEQLQTAQARVPHPSWSDMDNAINNAFQRMLRGEQSPQEALDQAAEEINALIAGEAPPEPEAEQPVAEPVAISYWHTMSDPETEQLANVVAAFEAANPGIKVETTRFAYDDFKPALLTGLAGGEAPDTARMDIAWVSEFADQGALMQLDGVMPGFEEIADGTFPGPLSTNYWQGHYYGLPQNTNTQVLLWHAEDYEAAGLSSPPATMEEFAEAACALTSEEEQYGYALGGTYFWAPAPVFYAMGGQIVDENITTASGYINGAESVAAFDMLTKLYNDGCISPNVLGGGIGTADGHATGLYANIIDGPWMVDIYKGNYPDFEVNFALIPTGPDGTTSSVVGGEDVVIFESTEHADAAMAWAAYLLSEESQLMMAEVGVIPTLKNVIGDESLPEYFNVFLEQLQTAQARVPHPAWSDMDNAINNAFQRMLRGEQSPQEALDQAAEEINALLQ